MYLHNDSELFVDIIHEASMDLNIDPSIIEKDYYVTLFLRKIVEIHPNIIFKGGTSLSKCYKIINRFSEDIDLNIQSLKKPTEGERKRLKTNIVCCIEDLNFELVNLNDIRSRRDFNKYIVKYDTLFNAAFLKQNLIIETAVFMRSYPIVQKYASNYIYEYLFQNNHQSIIDKHIIKPFVLNVQSAERTMIDKLYALGDYYLSKSVKGHSRHIYDIHKILSIIDLEDPELRLLNKDVREERKNDKFCLSAKENIDLKSLVNEIINTKAYEEDYNNITMSLLFEKVEYKTAIQSLVAILDSNLL